jgi:hypothetical protein
MHRRVVVAVGLACALVAGTARASERPLRAGEAGTRSGARLHPAGLVRHEARLPSAAPERPFLHHHRFIIADGHFRRNGFDHPLRPRGEHVHLDRRGVDGRETYHLGGDW